MRVLYFEPAVYYPYKLNLRKANALVLDKMVIDGGSTITPGRNEYKVSRPFKNHNWLCVCFNEPKYMELGGLEGTLGAITVLFYFTINDGVGPEIKLTHKQHVQFSGCAGKAPHYCIRNGRIYGEPQYSTYDGIPATVGTEGLTMLKQRYAFTKNESEVKAQLLNIEHKSGDVVIQYGLHPDENEGFVIETYSHINPSSELKHGTIN
jgi:hypothetical protein